MTVPDKSVAATSIRSVSASSANLASASLAVSKSERPGSEKPFPPIINERFDDMDTADIEFVKMEMPERVDA